MRRKANQSGQVALIVLLTMIVMLTLGISVVQRGLFDVKLTQQEEESSRAFQAAETGVEETLRTLAASSGSLGIDTTYSTTVNAGGGSGLITLQPVSSGETLAVDLTGSTGTTSMDIYFIDTAAQDCDSNPAAIEVSVLRDVGGVSSVQRDTFDVESRNNGFTVVSKGNFTFEEKTFCAKTNVQAVGGSVELRVRPVYSSATIGVDPRPDGATITGQYQLIRSEGQTGSGITRAVEVQRTDPQAPSVFDYVLFSGGSLEK